MVQEAGAKLRMDMGALKTLMMRLALLRRCYRGNSLAVQWLGLSAFTAGVRVQSLVGELRSCKPQVWVKERNKKKERKEGRKRRKEGRGGKEGQKERREEERRKERKRERERKKERKKER